ncbi:MAG: NAD-dependent epimerase/dehydratase family protein [Patescibacteria group bacterium]
MKLSKNLKIGITGSQGFIGGHIAVVLKNQGVKLSFFDLPKNDLLKPGKNLENFIKDKDAIFHTAAVNRGTDTEIIVGSVVSTYNLISAIEKLKKRPKLIFLSSIQAETETLYGKSKRLAEIMLEDFSKKNKIPVVIFRLTNVFGEGCKPFYNSVVATFCYQAANGKELTVNPESRNKKINLIYVKNVASEIVKEISCRRNNNFYLKNINSKNEISIGDLAKLIQSFKNQQKLKSLLAGKQGKFYKDLYKTYLSYVEK